MPLIKSLSKVNKKLSKQSAGALHVKGRKFKQLNRATEREIRLKAKKLQYAEQKNHELLFYLYIQETISEEKDKTSFTHDEMRQLVDTYIRRNDEEIARMDAERRPGRPMTNKHQIQVEKRKHDQHIFETGFKIPDLTDVLTTERVKTWNGTSGATSAWKFTLIAKKPEDKSTDSMIDV